MRFLIDECLMPSLAMLAHDAGYEATSVRDLGRLAASDWNIVPHAIDNDFVVVTHNSRDFRGTAGRPGYLTAEPLHPGLVCLNSKRMSADLQRMLFRIALDFIGQNGIGDLMNQVIEVDHDEGVGEAVVRIYEAPASA